MLRELGLSPRERAIFSLPSPLLPWIAVVAIFLLTLIVPALIRQGPVGAVLSAAIVLASLVFLLFPRKLLLGEDGLLLVWMGARFVPYRDIAYVEMSDGLFFRHPGINIVLRNGKAIDFATSIFKERWAERDALLTLIRASIDDAAGKKPVDAPQGITRSGRPHSAWARALRGIGNGAQVDARTPAVLSEDLFRVAESSSAHIVDRTAAFVALAATRESSTVERLRIALDRTAAPEDRAALRGVLDAGQDEEELARVLEYAETTNKRA